MSKKKVLTEKLFSRIMHILFEDSAEIQLQDLSGNWRTMGITSNDSQVILNRMRSLQMQHPNMRVRAVDRNGAVLDIL